MSYFNYFVNASVNSTTSSFIYTEQGCRRFPKGDAYVGTTTPQSPKCDIWDTAYQDEYYVTGRTGYLEKNYCRNPIQYRQIPGGMVETKQQAKPWCYRSFAGLIKETACDVPFCGK